MKIRVEPKIPSLLTKSVTLQYKNRILVSQHIESVLRGEGVHRNRNSILFFRRLTEKRFKIQVLMISCKENLLRKELLYQPLV